MLFYCLLLFIQEIKEYVRFIGFCIQIKEVLYLLIRCNRLFTAYSFEVDLVI